MAVDKYSQLAKSTEDIPPSETSGTQDPPASVHQPKSFFSLSQCFIVLFLGSTVVALLIWLFRVPRFDLVLDVEVPSNAGGKLEVEFLGESNKTYTEPVRPWNQAGHYEFFNIPLSFQSLRLTLVNDIGADIFITRLAVVTSKSYLQRPEFVVRDYAPETLAQWALSNLAPGPASGQFRSTHLSSNLEIKEETNLQELLRTNPQRRIFYVFVAQILLGVSLLSFVVLLIRYGFLAWALHVSWLLVILSFSFMNWLWRLRHPREWPNGKVFVLPTFALFCVFLFCLFGEVFGHFLLKKFPDYERERRLLGGLVVNGEELPRYTGEAYLNYIATPGYEIHGYLQHNKDGYRGDALPMQKSPHTLRLLFFGGSTTYGTVIHDPKMTLPAQTGSALSRSALLRDGKPLGVEVINAGMDFATSAEFVTHYIMKYRFYKPDIVIVQCGLNDALSADHASYQPDYTHWREPFTREDPLPFGTRSLMRSRLFSFLTLHALHYNRGSNDWWVHNRTPDAAWYPSNLNENTSGFRNNIETLVREVQADGGHLILLPDRLAEYIGRGGSWEKYLSLHESILREVATERGEIFAENSRSIIKRGRYVDGVHLNADGEGERAEYIAGMIKSNLARF